MNAIAEEQHNLNKELLEAETIGAKMNEQERESLFTKSEHARLSSKLSDIMLDITDLQGGYMRDLETATSDTIEEVTNQYERQYELKMKEYEIVKAELSLAKAQQVLENTENERSVRTWNGSNWVYEANLQDVLDAQENVENAKYEFAKAKAEEEQQSAINAIDAEADALQTEKNKLATVLDEMAEKMSGAGKDIAYMLETIAKTDLPTFEAIIQTLGTSIESAFGISDRDISGIRERNNEKYALNQMKSNSVAWLDADKDERRNLEAENKRLGNILGLEFEEGTGKWKKADGTYAYETVAKNIENGLKKIGKGTDGSDIISAKDIALPLFNGDEVISSPQWAAKLQEMASQNYSLTPIIPQPDLPKVTPIEDRISNAINNSINNISSVFGDTYMYTIRDLQLSDSEGGNLKGLIDYLKKKI